ncbi:MULTISPECIES: RNA polymerase sigma factor SigJ [unclassified Pseudofrankia]|uniref:RNA polymerase sigma factor SigJ n=1 Tax=unclassified Pseudofrankia TaxID=2994372 RepID=UPI0008D9C043|nr:MULTISPECIES: RNA polymerase sigma factor SigJ [unclassified Pseudofrankia]MDT3438072.1 RNA polymerase sigma factor SigJ [Pseudofrankia sp. BMG5.37]OHV56793.1 RNA polymerase subunit sigma-70 [Pseudofrankia sp. BMG5.36]
MTDGGGDPLTEQFETHRPHLRAVAYRMLGSLSEADDAVQDAWLRLTRADRGDVVNLPGWLTTVVARICLDMLRARRARREEQFGVHLPEPLVSREDATDPEQEVLLADAIGLALLVVLDTLTPAERIAFVLHDLFGVPFDEVGRVVRRSPAAATQLASRARRRVRGAGVTSDVDRARHRELVDAFQAAARDGDLDGLLAVLDPDVVLRADAGTRLGASGEARGARAVAAEVSTFAPMAPFGRRALVNGVPGIVVIPTGMTPTAILGFTVRGGRITEIDVFADPDRLRRLDLTAFAP